MVVHNTLVTIIKAGFTNSGLKQKIGAYICKYYIEKCSFHQGYYVKQS